MQTKILKKSTATLFFTTMILLAVVVDSCQKDYLVPRPLPTPNVGVETATLEANKVQEAPNSVNSAYWRTANFLTVQAKDINTKNLYSADGLLNLTNTFNGLSDFNNGQEAEIVVKAAYDANKLYMYFEWSDETIDASRLSHLFDGPEDPLNSSSSAEDWTSQRNDDQLSIAFDINGSSSAAGTFSEVGCAASCHSNEMKPEFGSVDIWNWSLALSEPLGYALDMNTNPDSGLINDEGRVMYQRNSITSNHRSGPKFEWDGETQNVTRPDGSLSILDPGFYLLNKSIFTGDAKAGGPTYERECGETCHGVHGEGYGPDLDGTPFNKPGVMNRYSRSFFKEFSISDDHSGKTTFATLTPQQVDDVIAKVRGFTGVPGYYLEYPDGSHADITTSSNVILAKLNPKGTRYKLVLIRDLETTNTDDVQFDLDKSTLYTFGLALMDGDGVNHIGSIKETLTFIKQ
jgi:hypothetical protein